MICLMHLTSLLCMEKPRKQNLFVPYTEDANAFTLTTLKSVPDYQPIPLTANEPGWEKLNEIGDIKNTYHSPLEPITQYTTSWVPRPASQRIIEKLYDQAYFFAHNNWNRDIKNKDLLLLLRNIHEAERYNINEDIMGAFAYNQTYKEGYFTEDSSRARGTILLFGYFKKYRLNATEAKELLPPHNYFDVVEEEKKIAINLSKQLGITLTKVSYQKNTEKKTSADFPHFWQLAVHLKKLFGSGGEKMKTLVCYIYNQENLSKDYPHETYTDLKAEFYKETAYLLELFSYVDEPEQRTYNLIQMIENGKKAKEVLHEKDLALSILKSDKLTFSDYFRTQEYITNTKNKAILLCNLIDHYNTTKKGKITPIPDQWRAYNVNNGLYLALPDSFNHTLFDKDMYAFEELDQLLTAIKELKYLKSKDIQKCVTDLYGKHDS